MSILVIGVNHRSGPLSILERVAMSPTEVPKAVESIVSRDNVREAVVLSTCNRIEIYAVTEKFHGAYADIRDFLCDLSGLGPDELHPHLYSEHDDEAVRHLFDVAAGLDSAVLGESEIMGQLRQAWEIAQAEGGARTTLNLLFRHAIGVGKRARTETAIARGTASVSHAAVEMAIEVNGSIDGSRVTVVGAGAMGEGIAVALRGAGVGDVTVVNRSTERAEALARRVDGVAVEIDRLADAIDSADVVLTGTGAGQPLITRELVGARSHARPLLLVDIAVPRDVAGDVAELDGVTVLDLDDLTTWANRGHGQRLAEVDKVRTIIGEATDVFTLEAAALQAAPLIASLRDRAETLRQGEIQRCANQIAHLSDDQQELIESITRRLVAKLLHEPSVRLRHQAGTPQGARNAAAVSDLFDLG